MDISKDDVEYLSSALESHVVTYHTAARDLNIHVSKAKQMLLDYYNLNKERVTASYVVTGTRLGNTVVRVFQNETEFNSQAALLDSIRTVHVYCLALNNIVHSEVALEELRHPVDLADLPRYYALGLTKGTELDKVEVRGKPAPPKQQSEKQKPQTEKPQTEAPKPEPKLEYRSRKEKPKQPTPISNYVSRKGESKLTVPAKRASDSKPAYQYKSRKAEQSQPKERVVISSMEEEEPPAEIAAETAPAAAKSDLNNLFLDDLSDFSDDTKDDAEEPIVVENKDHDAVAGTANDKSASVAPQVPEDLILRSLASSKKSASPTPQKSPTPPSQTSVDDDGYITTYRAKDPAPKKALAPPRDAVEVAKAKKTDGKKKQASLMSFFDKR